MKRSLTKHGKLFKEGHGTGTITPEMVEKRARELAVINGRNEDEVNEGDREQALKELEGLTTARGEDPEGDAVTNEADWSTAPGTSGQRADTRSPNDEQTLADELVNQGLEEAEHERMIQAEKNARKREET